MDCFMREVPACVRIHTAGRTHIVQHKIKTPSRTVARQRLPEGLPSCHKEASGKNAAGWLSSFPLWTSQKAIGKACWAQRPSLRWPSAPLVATGSTEFSQPSCMGHHNIYQQKFHVLQKISGIRQVLYRIKDIFFSYCG